jgi:hypothetical protein
MELEFPPKFLAAEGWRMADDSEDEDQNAGDEASYPPQVETLHAALIRLLSVTSVTTGLKNLAQFEPRT